MINISPRVVGIIIVSLFAIGLFTFLFMVDPMAVVAVVATLLFAGLLVISIGLIGENEWPWKR